MKITTLLTTVVLGLTLSTSHANDINLSWDVRTLKGQAISSIVKNAEQQKVIQALISWILIKKHKSKQSTKVNENEMNGINVNE